MFSLQCCVLQIVKTARIRVLNKQSRVITVNLFSHGERYIQSQANLPNEMKMMKRYKVKYKKESFYESKPYMYTKHAHVECHILEKNIVSQTPPPLIFIRKLFPLISTECTPSCKITMPISE